MQIVLVDASRVTLKLMTKMLNDNGHEVAAFADGNEAFAHLHGGAEVDVLMTSFEIPGISGLQLCWEARLIANAGRPLYVIAMSSNTDIAHLVEALDSGADDFVSKPPALPELYARLRAAERMNQAQRELVRLATRDFLTNLFNRRAFFSQAEELIRNRVPASVLLLDIDYFKRVNDTYGHDGGDLALLASHDYPLIARHLDAEAEDVREAVRLILSLQPRPGQDLLEDSSATVIPDVLAWHADGSWRVALNPATTHRVSINPMHERALAHAGEAAQPLREMLQEARWLTRGLSMRYETLLRATRAIVERQAGFLSRGDEAMAPLTLKEIAEEIGMHESTISRITTGKYLQTRAEPLN